MARRDVFWMTRALKLARRGAGRTAPNPCVGAVVVRHGRIIGEGFHARYGGAHAEVVALRQAGARARGAQLFVTLEPCDHTGQTPPCTETVLRSGIREVICAMRDPHPLVNGRGLRRLRRAGVRVRVGLLRREAEALNRPFLTAIHQRRPYVTLKMAQTLDGKIATVTRRSRWITGAAARRIVHQLRRAADAILIGVGTVLADDPRLAVRADGVPSARDPWKIIVDGRLRTPLSARVVRSARRARVLIATTQRAPAARGRQLTARGIHVAVLPSRRGRVRLAALHRLLLARGVQHVLIEGGGEIAASALAERLVDRVVWFVAPKILGGTRAPTSVGGPGIAHLSRAIQLAGVSVRRVGSDLMITGDVVYS